MGNLIPLILVVFGTILGALGLWKVFHMVKTSINRERTSISEHDFDRLARAFIQHKKEMHQRVHHLESMIDESAPSDSTGEIEADDYDDRNLTNDLNNKNRVRS